ncbi:tRNA1(Val) (adenine(37)-N6)-methyltransferase [Herbivorax sp. ANBcel31]|uniref:tRNA1(Val) (adenine(37)-N6)-methyltransferase n=1 Tax=Herbivorax sp. ANBcel31 TaxID=3069754 RepID=UPI0027B244BA|nr:tRNA1(Val) (adenine(37)-N6)-methyltransferase [Herbivorax sp. ANBcel31]MDQ2086366.1 tRNA1(Val) (adenine(37)-N6)-methyltransferase [Herbivorax sp. ANBcel31]
MDVKIKENERIDDLQYKGLKIIQKEDAFCFGLDAVLVANFTDIKKNDFVVDLGTGTGIIPILIAGKTEAKSILGIEIQEDMAEMAKRSIKLNDIGDRVKIICGDLKKSVDILGSSKFNVIVSNPPYMNAGGGLLSESNTKAVSRHEIFCTLEDVVKASEKLLKPKGQLAMVHRPDRLVDIIWLMRKYSIEPKYMRFVHPSAKKKANLILVKGIKHGRPQLKMMEPLYVYNEHGIFSDEINKIYCRGGDGDS